MAQRKPTNDKQSNQRWTPDEVDAFLDAIIAEIDGDPSLFEKPTAHLFYEKIRKREPQLQRMSHINLKNKFNYLKRPYATAIKWRSSTGAGVLDEGETIEDRLNFMCKNFDKLDQILSGKKNVNLPPIMNTLDDEIQSDVEYEEVEVLYEPEPTTVAEERYSEPTPGTSANTHLENFSQKTNEPTLDVLSQSSVVTEHEPKPKRMKVQGGPAFTLMAMQEKRSEAEMYRTDKQIAIERDKLEMEKERISHVFSLDKFKVDVEKQKLEFERTKWQAEMDIRRDEMRQNFEIRMMELANQKSKVEAEERIKRMELELKKQD